MIFNEVSPEKSRALRSRDNERWGEPMGEEGPRIRVIIKTPVIPERLLF
jgi:hypothetical protein